MTRPDLSDPEQRRLYRAELRRLYLPWRYGALALLVAGAIGGVYDPGHEPLWTALVVLGGAIVVAVIVARARYHRRRMGEDHQV